MPLLASVVVIVLIAASFGYYYATTSSNTASLNGQLTSLKGQVTSLNGQVSTLNLNITHQESARQALLAQLNRANATITSLTSEAGSLAGEASSQSSQINSLSEQASSQSSQIATLSSIASLNVETNLVNNQNFNVPFNSTTTIASFTVSTGGYLQISGTSDTPVYLFLCYGATSLNQCDASTTYYEVGFLYGGETFNAPLMPGPVWIMVGNYYAGTATLTINEWT